MTKPSTAQLRTKKFKADGVARYRRVSAIKRTRFLSNAHAFLMDFKLFGMTREPQMKGDVEIQTNPLNYSRTFTDFPPNESCKNFITLRIFLILVLIENQI